MIESSHIPTEAPSGFGAIALMFPGQGSQVPGMGVDLAKEHPKAGQILELADERLGYSLSKIMAGQRGDDLQRTIHTQPAVFVASIALLEVLKDTFDLKPVIAAGHSLGEYTALVAAGALDFENALDVIHVRASAMDSAQPEGSCAMAALVGPSKEDALRMVEEYRGDSVLEAANFNAPDQTVISGHLEAIDRLIEGAKELKRTRCVLLPVSSAFHTGLMEPARVALQERLTGTAFQDAQFPVVSNVDAVARVSGEEEKKLLVDQIVKPVLWTDCVNTMRESGANTFLEIGPGKVLTGLLRRIDRKAVGVNVSDLESIKALESSIS